MKQKDTIKQLRQQDLYYCYNPYKKKYLAEKGIRYIFKNVHYKTGKTFWVYLKGDDLNNALDDWYEELKNKN